MNETQKSRSSTAAKSKAPQFTDAEKAATGVTMGTYQPAGAIKLGSFA